MVGGRATLQRRVEGEGVVSLRLGGDLPFNLSCTPGGWCNRCAGPGVKGGQREGGGGLYGRNGLCKRLQLHRAFVSGPSRFILGGASVQSQSGPEPVPLGRGMGYDQKGHGRQVWGRGCHEMIQGTRTICTDGECKEAVTFGVGELHQGWEDLFMGHQLHAGRIRVGRRHHRV